MIGRTLAHYEVLAKIGQGGMGEVYRARDTKLDREVAIKILPREMSGDPERVARFQREARTLAALQHSNIASIYGFEDTVEARFLVMELVEGEDLSERLSRGAVPVEEATAILRQLVDGLEAAHERNIVHRDLKPANIKLGPDGVVKILDFGLARAYTGDQESSGNIENSPTITAAMTQVGTILGTAAYMSPEQAKGRAVDRRADIWACGVILWEMLSGQRLFSGDSISDTLAGVLRQEIDDSPLPEATPPALRGLLHRCLQRDPRQRLQHIGDARLFLDGEIHGAVATRGGRSKVWRWAVAGLAALSLSLLALRVLAPRGTPGPPHGELRRWSFEQADDGVGTPVVAQVSPDGRSIGYVDGAGVWIRSVSELEPRMLQRSKDCNTLTWSPDSQWILYTEKDRLFRISPTGGQPHPVGVLAGGGSASSTSIAWDAKDRVVIGTGVTGLVHIPTLGGESEILLPVENGESDFHNVAALPAGRGWVFIVHEESGNYGRLDLLTEDGERRLLLDLAPTNLQGIFVDPAGYLLFHREGSNAGIWAVRFSTEELTVLGDPFLVAPKGVNASVSNDGTLTYTQDATSDQGELQWIDRSGAVVASLGSIRTNRPFPRLLPGGREFVLPVSTERGRDIWSFDATSGLGRQIYQSERNEEIVSSNSDGTQLYTYAVGEGGYTIYRFPLRSPGENERVTKGLLPEVRDDLGLLYFSRLQPGGFTFDLCVMELDQPQAEPRVLVGSEHINWGAATSPNGQFMTYVSDESGSYQIYLTTLPEARSRWQVSVDGGHWPRWRPDGREIFFAEGDGIYSASFDGDDGVRLGAPSLLFEYRSSSWNSEWANGFDVDAKGERFLVVGRSEDTANRRSRVIVVENWAEEFRGQ